MISAGLALTVVAIVGLVYVGGRSGLQLGHRDPHRGAPAERRLPADLARISTYAADHQLESRPPQSRTGIWIEIPSLQVSLPIHEGKGGDDIPQWVALHYPGTVPPGAPGNSYLYAHGLWQMFGGLLYARAGDEVDLRDHDTGTVKVLHVTRVVGRAAWNDTRWIHASATQPTLTLQTCVDDDRHGDRFIVQAA